MNTAFTLTKLLGNPEVVMYYKLALIANVVTHSPWRERVDRNKFPPLLIISPLPLQNQQCIVMPPQSCRFLPPNHAVIVLPVVCVSPVAEMQCVHCQNFAPCHGQ